MAIKDQLPPLLVFGGDWDRCCGEAYAIFSRDFLERTASCLGTPVHVDKRKIGSDKVESFWHVTSTTDRATGNKLPDINRLVRIRWIRALIDNASAADVLCWRYKEGNGPVRVYIWARDAEFVVILEEIMGRKFLRLVTAFIVGYDSKKRDLMKRYDDRIR